MVTAVGAEELTILQVTLVAAVERFALPPPATRDERVAWAACCTSWAPLLGTGFPPGSVSAIVIADARATSPPGTWTWTPILILIEAPAPTPKASGCLLNAPQKAGVPGPPSAPYVVRTHVARSTVYWFDSAPANLMQVPDGGS